MSNQEPLRFVAADSGLFTWSMKKSDKTWYECMTTQLVVWRDSFLPVRSNGLARCRCFVYDNSMNTVPFGSICVHILSDEKIGSFSYLQPPTCTWVLARGI